MKSDFIICISDVSTEARHFFSFVSFLNQSHIFQTNGIYRHKNNFETNNLSFMLPLCLLDLKIYVGVTSFISLLYTYYHPAMSRYSNLYNNFV